MSTEYIVTFKTSEQISPDDWRVINPCMKVTDETTVAEINAFYRTHHKTDKMEVKIIEITSNPALKS